MIFCTSAQVFDEFCTNFSIRESSQEWPNISTINLVPFFPPNIDSRWCTISSMLLLGLLLLSSQYSWKHESPGRWIRAKKMWSCGNSLTWDDCIICVHENPASLKWPFWSPKWSSQKKKTEKVTDKTPQKGVTTDGRTWRVPYVSPWNCCHIDAKRLPFYTIPMRPTGGKFHPW